MANITEHSPCASHYSKNVVCANSFSPPILHKVDTITVIDTKKANFLAWIYSASKWGAKNLTQEN